ncbi:putative Peroxidase 48 isoform X2 [Nicotiana tabacum]|uniref:Peroxidase 48 isoform X2 n=1 Tax=Nicotiana tabacum TaxID=4097 RepID=A0AC58U925_TOBAC
MLNKNWALMAVFSFLVACIVTTMAAHAEIALGSASRLSMPLRYGYYDEKCEDIEKIVGSTMQRIVQLQHNVPAQLLRLLFHDCFIRAGGLYYPVLMGRRDSKESFFDETMAEIPRPNGNITETLRLFSLRGFDERETVALLGGHNIGKIGCEFIQLRFSNFMGTAIPSGFLEELMQKCPDDNSTITKMFNEHTARGLSESAMSYSQGLSALSSFGTSFDNHYYKTLMRGRGLLFADQQLMANEKTAAVVMDYALDEGTKFRTEFAHAMDKLSNIGVLTGFQEEVRHSCSHLNSDQ